MTRAAVADAVGGHKAADSPQPQAPPGPTLAAAGPRPADARDPASLLGQAAVVPPPPGRLMTGGTLEARLAGTGRLADDLYLMAHHDVTGRPYLQPRAAGLGLAGALLAELMLAGHLLAGPHAIVLVCRVPPADRLAGLVLSQVAREREQLAAGEWLAFLARTAAENVARRLAESGYLAPVACRRRWRGQRWVPVDPDCAFVPLTRARAALDPARPATPAAAALAGLAAACGLESRLLAYAPPGTRRSPQDAAAGLPPGLRYLIAQTRAAVDSAVLGQRR